MARVKVNYGAPFADILKSSGVRALLTEKAGNVLSAAQSSAPVDSGAYKASLQIEQATTDRAVVRVVASVPHAFVVEANEGTLSRALDSA